MPVIAQPFYKIYIDLVGPLEPSAEGHTHLLTILDSATNYPIAIPLKKTDSVSIAEALMSQFDQFGYPKYICNDNGSNLSSDIMKHIYKTFGIQMNNIPVYHPRVNKVERVHGVIKSILRKLIVDQPRMWHRYINPLLFAIRTTPTTCEFSSFELLFGRRARNHLSFLKELWTDQDDKPDEKEVYQYVIDLRNRITETCHFAQKQLSKIKDKNYRYFNERSKLRTFNPGDKVMVLNTKNETKFGFNWIGPAEILEKIGTVIYRIKFSNGNERVYHVNMLKAYKSRENEGDRGPNVPSKGGSLPNDEDGDVIGDNNIDVDETAAAVMGFIEVSDTEHDESDECNEPIQIRESITDLPIPSLDQKECWKDVKINPDLPERDRKRFWGLVEEFQDIFSDVPTQTDLVTHKIRVNSDEPVRHRPYRVPIHMKDEVEKELDKMLKMGWIEIGDSEYASPLVVVRKKGSNDLRLCVSYKGLNAVTVIDPTPMPDIEDVLGRIGKSRYFSKFDAAKGFYAIKMDPESKKYTAFVYQNAQYLFNVTPFGLVNSPSVYAKMMQKLLCGAKNLENFVDDILGYTDDVDSHLSTLRDLFERVRKANIKLKPTKVEIGFEEITFLGQVVGAGRIRPTDENIEKIVNTPIPRTKRGVQSLRGLVNWLRKFIPDAAQLLDPLNELVKKDRSEVVDWGQKNRRF